MISLKGNIINFDESYSGEIIFDEKINKINRLKFKTDNLIIHTDKRRTIMKENEQEYYIGERGRRGNMLKRGYRNVTRITSEIV